MRILMVANANYRNLGLRTYGTDTRLYNGFIRNGHNVLFFSDRDQARLHAPLIPSRKLGHKRANTYLIQVVHDFRPDMIILGHANVIQNKTLEKIKTLYPETRIVQFNIDAVFAPDNRKILDKRKAVVDATFITTAGPALASIAAKGRPAYYLPNPSDIAMDIGTCFRQENPSYDVVYFAHNNPWDDPVRTSLAEDLQSKNKNARLFYRGFGGQPSIRGHEYTEALTKAAMGLNISRSIIDGVSGSRSELYLYSSERVAHLMGNGVVPLIYNKGGFNLNDLYHDSEAIFFESGEELAEKVAYYTRSVKERMRMGEMAWKRAHGEFSSERVCAYIEDIAFGKNLSHDYAWPTKGYEPE